MSSGLWWKLRPWLIGAALTAALATGIYALVVAENASDRALDRRAISEVRIACGAAYGRAFAKTAGDQADVAAAATVVVSRCDGGHPNG